MNANLTIHFTEKELHYLRRAFSDYADDNIRWRKEVGSSQKVLTDVSEEFSIIAQKLRQLLAEKIDGEAEVNCA